ncbi:hypothetical protein AVEN_202819-1 [Araneus ventricosus]|uniref:Uncharacterized protein n=1 Tax=Araneus ventricosus TaxID=182803 RepID=A0A4Y2DP96_ARAVE|nr:hypothetical protein AVEN_202819-1 [Araneus ventricosus]
MERLRKLLAEVETNEYSDHENENNLPEDVWEKNFSDHQCFSEHDTESEEAGDSGNEENEKQRTVREALEHERWEEWPFASLALNSKNTVSRIPENYLQQSMCQNKTTSVV